MTSLFESPCLLADIGVSGVYLHLLYYFDTHRCSSLKVSFYALHINLLQYNDPKVITQSAWYNYTEDALFVKIKTIFSITSFVPAAGSFTHVLNMGISTLVENSTDQDQLASRETFLSGSTLFSAKSVFPNRTINDTHTKWTLNW